MTSSGVTRFGPKEDLQKRLKRIVAEYHGDLDLVYELLQNVDDAGATKLHLVLDLSEDTSDFQPTYPFAKNWSELQGPALLAWSDQVFSAEDYEGIQRLGEGTKPNALLKKGRFGVGCNICYSVTDCPAFISNDESLCIFDPCEYFTEFSRDHSSPGAMLDQTTMKQHPAIYNKFIIDEQHPLIGATVFRLALHPPATQPRIADQTMTLEKLYDLIEKLKSADQGQCLLFLQSVRELKLLVKQQDGAVDELFTIRVNVSNVADSKLQAFFTKCVEFEALRKRQLSDATPCFGRFSVSYDAEIITTSGDSVIQQSHWQIVQQIGYLDSDVARDEHLNQLFRSIKLLPLAGLATRIDGITTSGSVFAGLPLQLDTNLGMHVNGHFAFDSESRKSLFTTRNEDCPEATWNRQIFTRILPSLCIQLLSDVKAAWFGNLKMTGEIPYQAWMTAEVALETLDHYYGLFPNPEKVADSWALLAEAVLELIVRERHLLFATAHKRQSSSVVDLKWYSVPLRESLDEFCFTDHYDTRILKEWLLFSPEDFLKRNHSHENVAIGILLDHGAPIIYCPHALQLALSKRFKSIKLLSPDLARAFVVGVTRGWNLPQAVGSTPFGIPEVVASLANYCLTSLPTTKPTKPVPLPERVIDLPLLLAADGQLHRFAATPKLFYCSVNRFGLFQDSEFLHSALRPLATRLVVAGLVKQLAVEDVPQLLVSENALFSSAAKIRTGVFSCSEPAVRLFVTRLWRFLFAALDPWDRTRSFASLSALAKCSILPVVQPSGSEELWPLEWSRFVLNATSSSHDDKLFSGIIPSLNRNLLLEESFNPPKKLFSDANSLRHFEDLCCMTTDASIVSALQHMVKWNDVSHAKLQEIFRYFGLNSINLGFDAALTKQLPIFPTIFGEYVAIPHSSKVFWIERQPPSNVQENFLQNRGTFLQVVPGCNAKPFMESLGVVHLSQYLLYRKFILPCFCDMSVTDQVQHLQVLMDDFWRNAGTLVQQEWKELATFLSSLSFVKLDSGRRVRPSALYTDEPWARFCEYLPGKLLPGSYKDATACTQSPKAMEQWFQFFRDLGMKSELERADVRSIAEQLATEGCSKIQEHQAKVKDFVQCIYRGDNYEQNFNAILSAAIFLPLSIDSALPTTKALLSAVPALQRTHSLTSISHACTRKHATIAWTAQPILPDWALPVSKRDQHRPTLDVVLQHAKNFFTAIDGQLTLCGLPGCGFADTWAIAQDIYGFLSGFAQASDLASSNKIRSMLINIPVVVIEDATCAGKWWLIKPGLLSFDFAATDWSPFLYKAQPALNPYRTLFLLLGSTEIRSPAQCCDVLEKVHISCGDQPLDEHLLNLVKGVFSALFDVREEWNIHQPVWLPNRQLVMSKSSELVFLDRHTGTFGTSLPLDMDAIAKGFLFNFDLIKQGHWEEFIASLTPERKRQLPRPSSAVLRESIVSSCAGCPTRSDGQCEVVGNLAKAFNTEILSEALALLVKLSTTGYDGNAPDALVQHAKALLPCCRIRCLEKPQVLWSFDAANLNVSPIDVLVFMQADAPLEEKTIFVKHHADLEDKLSFFLELSSRLAVCLNSNVDALHLFVVLQFAYENAGDSQSMRKVLALASHASSTQTSTFSSPSDLQSRQELAKAFASLVSEKVNASSVISPFVSFAAATGHAAAVPTKELRLSDARLFIVQAKAWKSNAENAYASKLLTNDAVMFLCHQAAEFLVKAVAFYEKNEETRNHRLDFIASGSKQSNIISRLLQCDCDYIRTRYPTNHKAPSQVYASKIDDVESALTILEELYLDVAGQYAELF